MKSPDGGSLRLPARSAWLSFQRLGGPQRALPDERWTLSGRKRDMISIENSFRDPTGAVPRNSDDFGSIGPLEIADRTNS
jgi:hypothetical protein